MHIYFLILKRKIKYTLGPACNEFFYNEHLVTRVDFLAPNSLTAVFKSLFNNKYQPTSNFLYIFTCCERGPVYL